MGIGTKEIKICYRELKNYKYQLTTPFSIQTNIKCFDVGNAFVHLSSDGTLELSRCYAWDGPSGPAIDTLDFMRGSLVHDALYQLIRIGALPNKYREHADLMLYKICLEDGMHPFRANYVYIAVRLFGWIGAQPDEEDYFSTSYRRSGGK